VMDDALAKRLGRIDGLDLMEQCGIGASVRVGRRLQQGR
jgi:hypothetical protein